MKYSFANDEGQCRFENGSIAAEGAPLSGVTILEGYIFRPHMPLERMTGISIIVICHVIGDWYTGHIVHSNSTGSFFS